MTGTIVAMGGGGFSMEPDVPLLDDLVLEQTGQDHPRAGFLGTASGDADGYIERFHEHLGDRCRTSHLRLFSQPSDEPRRWVEGLDAIYVGGGSTANLLAVWRVHRLDQLLRAAHDRGAVLAGVSAGAMCWFEGGVTDSFGDLAPLRDGLGIVGGSFTPHYDGETDRRPALHRALERRELPPGYAADDGAALVLRDGRVAEAVASREGVQVYAVGLDRGRVEETPLVTHYLG